MFTGMPEMASYPKALLAYEFVDNDQESYFIYHINETMLTAMFLMEASGQVKGVAWMESVQDWVPFFAVPKAQCSVYFVCGSFAMCTENAFTFCSCIRGFISSLKETGFMAIPEVGAREMLGYSVVPIAQRMQKPIDSIHLLLQTYLTRLGVL